jgi:uncharacterized protein (DUF58 family)
MLMLTGRAFGLLFATFLLLLFGMLVGHTVLVLVGLAILLWFAWEWLAFQVRAHLLVPRLRLERTVSDDRGPVTTLWAGRIFHVRTRLALRSPFRLPFVLGAERAPFGAKFVEGDPSGQGPVGGGRAVEFAYSVRCDQVGVVRFEGARVQVADVQGFFHRAVFVPLVAAYRVLPILHEADPMSPVSKERNRLLPPGVHRLRTGGSGSELHDLRDYMSGDPPKTIAWKVSARRDRLITKVFENEVPIRCTLFVDVSDSVRVPTEGGSALQRLVEICGAVIRANQAARDLTGLCLFDEHGDRYAAPDRRSAHRNRLLRMFADAADRPPADCRADPLPLIPLAYSFASEVYPGLLANDVNRYPWWLTWVTQFPAYNRTTTLWHRLARNRLLWLSLLALPAVWVVSVLIVLPVYGAWRLWRMARYTGLADLAGNIGRRQAWRKKLAALLSVRSGMAPGGLAVLLEDDDAFSLLLQRFLAEHQVPYRLPLYGGDGRYLFAAPRKVPVLAAALRRSVGRGRDNELFVLFADLLELDAALDPVVAAVHVALSRHHQVLVVCPWPPGLPLPVPDDADAQTAPPRSLAGLLRRSTRRRYHAAFFRLRRAFGRLGVPVVCAAGDEPVPLILERINRLRTLRRTPT